MSEAKRKALTVGSLFAGIGGFDLGFERAGCEIKWQVEIDAYATRVLCKHWPDVRRYGDIRAIDWATVEPVDVLCGGFPCQPHSLAGARRASEDERDLWGEFVRALRGVRPRWVVAENVPGLLSSESGRFFGRVLRDLAESGYDAEWDCIPAAAIGAPHQRDRVWIVAYPNGEGLAQRIVQPGISREANGAHARQVARGSSQVVADANSHQQRRRSGAEQMGRVWVEGQTSHDGFAGRIEWAVEPNVGRVAYGVPARVDRLRGLGNAIVPQIAEWIARRIKEAEAVAEA